MIEGLLQFIEGFLQLGVCMLTLNRNAKQASKTRQKIRVRVVELARIRTISLEDTERCITLATASDDDVDRASDALFGQKCRGSEAGFFLQMIGYDRLAGLKGKAGWRLNIRAERYVVHCTRGPADARTHDQALLIRQIFQNFRERTSETTGT
ncbi:hypothetical protein OO17_00920 [Rhodopseudomonas palustris]|uniref:Uncharacterized protein n=1 Tax=Rhodopseudomonas palustris TaxID=1076 RepID=A0A0D7F8L1_RHOPL|nr:hypothetical protein OO17_00920 [Rhodopseudomonas palustris]